MNDEAAQARRPATARQTALRLLPILFIAALFAGFFLAGLDRHVSLQSIEANYTKLGAFVDRHYLAAVLIYGAAYAVVVAASLPVASLLTALGGLLFGIWLGTAYTVVAATIGATAVFLAARTAFGAALRPRIAGYLARMEGEFRENQASYLLFLRLLPIFPFWVVNLAPAFLGASLGVYLWTTFLGIIPGTAAYAVLGAGAGSLIEKGEALTLEGALTPEVIAALVALALLSLVPAIVKKLRRRRAATAAPDRDDRR